jgi:Na+/H+-dicarboxylate symporters
MRRLRARYTQVSLITKTSIALVLGVVAGLLLPLAVLDTLSPFGDLVLRLLHFLILPIVVSTVIVGINQSGLGALGRTGAGLAIYYLCSTAVAMTIGLVVALTLSPGDGFTLDESASVDIPDHAGLADALMSIVPNNIVVAFSQLNMLGILFTAIVFGVAIAVLRARDDDTAGPAEALYQGIAGLEAATLQIMRWVLEVLPWGILVIVAHTIGAQGVDALVSLGRMVGALYLGLAGQLVFYSLLLLVFGVSLRRFFASARTPMVTAFATQSSSGTLPVSMAAADQLGLSRSIHGVALPLGATINMDGAALRIAVSAVFAANVVGTSLGWIQLAEIVIIGTLISIGTAGVPGAGIVMIATVFSQVGLPTETVALLASIDALVGMGATALNVTGDLVGVTVLDRVRRRANARCV